MAKLFTGRYVTEIVLKNRFGPQTDGKCRVCLSEDDTAVHRLQGRISCKENGEHYPRLFDAIPRDTKSTFWKDTIRQGSRWRATGRAEYIKVAGRIEIKVAGCRWGRT